MIKEILLELQESTIKQGQVGIKERIRSRAPSQRNKSGELLSRGADKFGIFQFSVVRLLTNLAKTYGAAELCHILLKYC